MRTFDRSGHITESGFSALMSGAADELSRFEMAEHLDWCDRCVDRYSLKLTDGLLFETPKDFSGTVMARIRRRALRIITGQTAKVCAAACLAIVIWCGGIFDGDLMTEGEMLSAKITAGGSGFSQMVSGIGNAIGDWLSGLSINARGEYHAAEK